MKTAVNEPRPRRDPRFNHENLSTRPQGAESFRKKRSNVRHVVQYIGHHDRAQRIVLHGNFLRVQNKSDVGTEKDFRSDQFWNVLAEESGSRTQLKHVTCAVWKFTSKKGVPLF